MNLESSCAINSDNIAAEVLAGHSLLQNLEPKNKGTVASKLFPRKLFRLFFFFFYFPTHCVDTCFLNLI